MIKNFECYAKGESVTIGAGYLPATLWVKTYPDGQTAEKYVASNRVTRALVRESFEAQEKGYRNSVFTKQDSGRWFDCIGREGEP
jgi:hypothetical protein